MDGVADCGAGCVTVGILGGVSVATGGVRSGPSAGRIESISEPMLGHGSCRSDETTESRPASSEDQEEVVVAMEEE